MGDDNYGTIFVGDQALHLFIALLFEFLVADTQYFVDQHNVCFKNSCDGKSQFGIHTAGISSDRHINELADFSKINDFLFFGFDLFFGKTKKHTGKSDIFTAGHLTDETDTDGQE